MNWVSSVIYIINLYPLALVCLFIIETLVDLFIYLFRHFPVMKYFSTFSSPQLCLINFDFEI